MLRAMPDAAYLPDWLTVPWEAPGGRVCVCDEPIPEDWTYFEVFFEDVNFVAVSPVAGDPEELNRSTWRPRAGAGRMPAAQKPEIRGEGLRTFSEGYTSRCSFGGHGGPPHQIFLTK